MIKILFIISSCKKGGAPVDLYKVVSKIDKRAFNVEVVAPNDGEFFNKFSEKVQTHDLKIRGFYPGTLFRLRRILKGCDIVNAWGKGPGLYARLACIGTGTKVVYGYHGFHFKHYPKLKGLFYLLTEKILLMFTEKVICVSRSEKEKATAAGVLNEDKAVILPNGVVMEKFANHEGGSGLTIGTLSRISIQKGLEYLVPAIDILKKQYPELICLVAGGTQKEDKLYEQIIIDMIKEYDLEDTIKLLGEVTDVPAFLSGIDLYVSSALWEGLPGAILEAFAAKVPVVATDVTGNDEIVINNETGILVEPQSSQALAEGIDHAFKHRDKLKELSDNAWDLVSRKYSVEKMISNHEMFYKKLVNQ